MANKKFLSEGKFLLTLAARVPGTQHWGVIHAMGQAPQGTWKRTPSFREAPGLGGWREGVLQNTLVLFSSSSCEFGVAFESAGEDEGEDGVGASQAAVQAVTTEEAVRRYIRSTPALYRKVLLYQPFELAELQAELKQQGIRMTTGKLLDFLDAHCITFTTAAARKEKLERKRQQPVGRKKRGKTDQPVPRSPPTAISSL